MCSAPQSGRSIWVVSARAASCNVQRAASVLARPVTRVHEMAAELAAGLIELTSWTIDRTIDPIDRTIHDRIDHPFQLYLQVISHRCD